MRSLFKRSSVTRAVVAVGVYWSALFAISLLTAGTSLKISFLQPLLLLGAVPVFTAAALTFWRAGRVRLSDLAFLDDLTGLRNRRAYMQRGTELVHGTGPGVASLILLDVDGLKGINDNCGHQAGDELLAQTARHLSQASKAVYRIGGDEFAILVDRSKGDSVTALMRSLTPLNHHFKVCGHDHVIQFSYGFASRRDQETFEELFSRADARLRQFKQRLYSSGRKQERRITHLAASAELERVIAEAENDDAIDEGSVVSIFSRKKPSSKSDGPISGAR